MATGDVTDIFGRLKRYVPKRWFGSPSDSTPMLDALLTGIATVLSWVYGLYAYAALQTRIATATDGWLDLVAYDYFGTGLPRKSGESDASYRARILANLLRGAATRQAISAALTALTGAAPIIVEPWRPADTGAYRVPTSGYGMAGYYGSLRCPAQAFITAYRPISTAGIASVAGYGVSTGAYGTPSQAEYADLGWLTGGVQDADIYALIAAVKAEGTAMWVRLANRIPVETELAAPGFPSLAHVAGYRTPTGAYGTPSQAEYATKSMLL